MYILRKGDCIICNVSGAQGIFYIEHKNASDGLYQKKVLLLLKDYNFYTDKNMLTDFGTVIPMYSISSNRAHITVVNTI